MRRHQRRLAQQLDQAQVVRAERRLRREVRLQLVDHPDVGGLALQARVVEQLQERRERRVRVRQPEHQQLFEHDLAVRRAGRLAAQVRVEVHLAAVERDGRELVREAPQGGVDAFRPEALFEPAERPAHRGRVHLLPVLSDDEVEDLVDQPHRVDLARLDRLLREAHQVAPVVHLLREHPRGVEVGEDDVAGQREQGVVELEPVPRATRDVELEGRALGAHACVVQPCVLL
jgi:hypothetical protein